MSRPRSAQPPSRVASLPKGLLLLDGRKDGRARLGARLREQGRAAIGIDGWRAIGSTQQRRGSERGQPPANKFVSVAGMSGRHAVHSIDRPVAQERRVARHRQFDALERSWERLHVALLMEQAPTPSPASDVFAIPAEPPHRLRSGAEPSVMRLHTHDIDQQAEKLQHWDQSYVQLSPGRFEGRLIETWFGDIHFFREITNQVIHERGCSRPGTRTFCVPLAMEGRATFRGTAWQRDMCATLGGDAEFDLRTSTRLDVVAVSFRSDRLAEIAFESGIDPSRLERWLSSSCTLRLPSERVDDLRRMLIEVAMLIDGHSALLRNPGVFASIEAAIYEAFLRLMADSVEVCRASGSYLTRRRLVNRAIDLVAAHPDALLTVGDLCRLLQVSRRTLQLYFEDVLQISPLQYLRAFRLSRVRALLHAEGGQLRIQDAAARWGFWHLSQFARDYKRLFGELPSQTAIIARRRGEAEALTPT